VKRRGDGTGAGKPVPSELPVVERREKAHAAALRLLAVRDRSVVELRSRLRDKGYDAETVTYVLEKLTSARLLDDRRFAEGYAESAVRSKGLAARVIQTELRRRGIDKETAAVASTRSPEEEEQNAREIAARRAARLGSYPVDVQARRLRSFLQRRGYGAELCTQIVAELVRADDD
jgi:regulatory protein